MAVSELRVSEPVAARRDAPPPAFEPYIASDTIIRELTPLPLILGTLLGVIFGASSLYLVLKVGLTVSASIPVAVLGGLLGILMMIPLRRALIVHQHGVLKYPEGTACAEVLKAGASAESQALASPSAKAERAALGGAATSAATIFTGFGVGFLYKAANVAFKGWKDVP